MSRGRAFFLVLLVWAAIYLPRLGTLEIKSEEGRRVLPAVTMLESGNYLVPQIGSEPYFRKPPLVNWLVAGSFKLFGARNEWTARLPSVLCVLAAALAFVGVARRSLGGNGAVAAALMWLTNFGLLEKGRMIEIEALYVSLTALAFICWFSFWRDRPWRAWIGAGVFLGLGLLAKGPLNLLFFYAVVVAVLFHAGKLRQLSSRAHITGVLIFLGIFAAWAIPCLAAARGSHVAHVWTQQLSGRLGGSDFKFANWILNLPRGIAYLLPWAVLLPFARLDLVENEDERRLCRGLSLGLGAPFVLLSLLPSTLPRYNMPLLAPAIWLLAILIKEHALVWPKPLRKAITGTVIAVVASMLIYSLAIVPFLEKREKIRPLAAQLDAAIPPNEPLYAVDPDYQPYLFYLHRRIIYVSDARELPDQAHYFLVRPAARQSLPAAHLVFPIKDYRGQKMILLKRAG